MKGKENTMIWLCIVYVCLVYTTSIYIYDKQRLLPAMQSVRPIQWKACSFLFKKITEKMPVKKSVAPQLTHVYIIECLRIRYIIIIKIRIYIQYVSHVHLHIHIPSLLIIIYIYRMYV